MMTDLQFNSFAEIISEDGSSRIGDFFGTVDANYRRLFTNGPFEVNRLKKLGDSTGLNLFENKLSNWSCDCTMARAIFNVGDLVVIA